MKLLCFLVEHFRWEPFSRTLPEAGEEAAAQGVGEAAVIFYQAELADMQEEREGKVFKKCLKHVKWLANKKGFKTIVLHSFTHLGGATADAAWAEAFALRLKARLQETGYAVWSTPFGWFCSWEIKVLGESLAKVWKEI